MQGQSPLLEIANLSRRFGGLKALNGADIAIAQGTITGLIGPNGAGKSTLFNVVSGLMKPDAGEVRFAGADITGHAPDALVAAGLVRTFQLARGFPKLTVFDHLMLYGPAQPGERFAAGLFGSTDARRRESELSDKALTLARRLKLDAVLANPVTALSGGQKKLLEIGRALMAEPKLILLDEPMAGVNPTLAGAIAEHLQSIRADGVTIALIEHDMGLVARLCDKVYVMAEGRKLAEGAFAEIAANPDVQDAYLGRRR
ncbi:ABC transporter ATP-binding protein [Terrarubrum flagellatum]|uniref:ABC transporter ATP-binding protein n=1 Tax=Terrirubrum flagellatum TaxID=2895980 RepID=UPI0031455807